MVSHTRWSPQRTWKAESTLVFNFAAKFKTNLMPRQDWISGLLGSRVVPPSPSSWAEPCWDLPAPFTRAEIQTTLLYIRPASSSGPHEPYWACKSLSEKEQTQQRSRYSTPGTDINYWCWTGEKVQNSEIWWHVFPWKKCALDGTDETGLPPKSFRRASERLNTKASTTLWPLTSLTLFLMVRKYKYQELYVQNQIPKITYMSLWTARSDRFPEMGCGQRISGKLGIRHAVFPVDRRVSRAPAPTGNGQHLLRGGITPMP